MTDAIVLIEDDRIQVNLRGAEGPRGGKGDPGGNIMAVGLFTEIDDLTIPLGTQMIMTSGHTVEGIGAARYAYDVDVDAGYVADNPLTAAISIEDRGWKLAEETITPYMFGAMGDAFPAWVVTPGTAYDFTWAAETGATDDTVAVQAAIDYLFSLNPEATLDMSGATWGISATLYFVFPAGGWSRPRRFVGGHFYLLPAFAEGPEEGAIVQGGYDQMWSGDLYIDGGIRGYPNRRCTNALVVINSNSTDMCKIRVDGSKRDAIKFNRTDTSITVRTGSDYEVTFVSSNNIAYKGTTVYGRWNGMNATKDLSLPYYPFTAIHGGTDATTDIWDPTPASFIGSQFQRSRLTLTSGATTDYRVGDIGKVRLEVAVATYTSYAADAAAGTITWTAGDPVAAGFAVGDKIVNDYGPNGTTVWTIKGFSGASNRVIEVYPKPAETHTAYSAGHAYAVFYKPYSYHLVTKIVNSTVFEVWPWLPPDQQTSGEWRSCHGAVVDIGHSNTATVSFDHVGCLGVGTAARLTGLYGARIGVFLPEYCDVGLVHGATPISVAFGSEIGLCHFEACIQDFLQVTVSQSSHISIGPSSAFGVNMIDPFVRSLPMNARLNLADKNISWRPFTGVTLDMGGETFEQAIGPSFNNLSNDTQLTVQREWELSNRPKSRHRTLLGNSSTVELHFYEDMARCFAERNWCELFWIGLGGADPTGALTFELTDALVWAGWSLIGTVTYTAPATPLKFRIIFDWENKDAIIVASSVEIGAGGGGGAWGSITGTLSAQTDLDTALGLKAPLAAPTLTGIPAAPTAAPGTNTTQLATTAFVQAAVTGGTVPDGDKGDITVSGTGTVWTIDNGAVTLAKMANMATASLIYRKTAGAGAPEVNTLATLKTDLGLTGTNSGDQTTIVGITGTKAQFDTANSDGDFVFTSGIGVSVQAYDADLTTLGAGGAGARSFLGLDTANIQFVIDGGGSAITTGVKGDIEVPFACTVTGWEVLADQSGSIVVDVWKDTYANFPPVVGDTIAGSEKPTLSAVAKNTDTSLTTWTTAIAAGDVLRFNVDSITTVTRVTVVLKVTR